MRLQDLLTPPSSILRYTGGCAQCPRGLREYVPPTLTPDAHILFIGEAPGATEVEQGTGFVGRAGTLLRTALDAVGIHHYAISNVIHCRPPQNRTPTATEVACCMHQHVLREIGAYPLVVLVGNTAMQAFYSNHASALRGNLAYHPDFPTHRFYGILHPAATLYGSAEEKARKHAEFQTQIARLGRIYHGEPPRHTITHDLDVLQHILHHAAVVSLDIETDRLASWDPGRTLLSFGVEAVGEHTVFLLHHTDPTWGTALELLRQFLTCGTGQVLGANIGFDLVWLEEVLGIRCRLAHIHDIQAICYQTARYKQASLKRLVSERLDGYRHLVLWPHLEHDRTRLLQYNADDVHETSQLFLQEFALLDPAQRKLQLDVGGPSSLALQRITAAGIYFRGAAWEDLVSTNRARRAAAVSRWIQHDPAVAPYIKDNGLEGLDKYLSTKYTSPSRTPKGNPSWDEAALQTLIRGGADELQALLDIRKADKEYSTYLAPYPQLVHTVTQCIHASFHHTTTATGRTSSSKPNMQNVPRGAVRNLFGARPGAVFLEWDWSQIELRLAMSLAGDPVGIAAYRSGEDLHTQTAQYVRKSSQITPEDRTRAKAANFLLIYGGGPDALAQGAANDYGVVLSDEEAKEWHRGFFSRYRLLPAWHDRVARELDAGRGFIQSAVGHRWYYADWNSTDPNRRAHAQRSAINMTCQGPAAYLTLYLIILIQQALYDAGIPCPGRRSAEVVLTVHDQIAVECAVAAAEEVMALVRNTMKKVETWASGWLRVPLVLDCKSGEAWGSLQSRKEMP